MVSINSSYFFLDNSTNDVVALSTDEIYKEAGLLKDIANVADIDVGELADMVSEKYSYLAETKEDVLMGLEFMLDDCDPDDESDQAQIAYIKQQKARVENM